MQQARAGDQAAFAELVRRYEPEVRIVVRVILGPELRPHLDSMDVMQSVHRTLLRGLRGEQFHIDSPQHLVSLAVQMARHKVAKKWRHVKRQERMAEPDRAQDSLPDFLTRLVSPEIDPARAAQVN